MLKKQPESKTAALDGVRADLHAISPCLNLRISTRARRLALRLDQKSGQIHLVVPPRAGLKKALAFAYEHRGWIDQHAASLPPPVVLQDGAILPVLGRDRTVQITHDSAIKRTVVTLHDDMLTVVTNKDDPTQRIIRFLKELARTEITRIARDKAATIGKTPRAVTVRDTKSRWGSCSEDGNLSFSWRLVLAPPESLDYLVAHEVAHLVHMNHGARFWALCEKLSADFSAGHGWMKQNGHSLMRYC